MDFLDGDLFWDPMIPSMTNRDRTEIYKNKNKTLAKLHSVDYKKIGLEDYGKPGNYVARQVSSGLSNIGRQKQTILKL